MVFTTEAFNATPPMFMLWLLVGGLVLAVVAGIMALANLIVKARGLSKAAENTVGTGFGIFCLSIVLFFGWSLFSSGDAEEILRPDIVAAGVDNVDFIDEVDFNAEFIGTIDGEFAHCVLLPLDQEDTYEILCTPRP